MSDGPLVRIISAVLLNLFGAKISNAAIFAVLYNLIPAVIFGPLLIHKGRCYDDWFIITVGICLLVVDSYHLVISSNKCKCKILEKSTPNSK